MPEEKFPTLPAEEAFTILEAPLIRLVRGKPVHKFSQASLTPSLPYSYRGPVTPPHHSSLKPRIIHWETHCVILSCKSACLHRHHNIGHPTALRLWQWGKFPCANTQLGSCQSGGWAMWLFHTASFRGQDEYQDTNLWFVAFCSTHLSSVNVRGERNDSWAHIWTVGTSVYDVLEKGFNDLMDLCDVVTEKFTSARDDLAAQQQK